MIPLSLFAFVSSITPGPNNLMILASGVNFGLRASLPHWMGIGFGFWVMLLSIGLGLGSVFTLYPQLYDIMKWLGVTYLLYLAFKIARSSSVDPKGIKRASPMSFLQAVAFQWVNPKAWIMAISCFSSYLPQGSSWLTIFGASLLFATINIPCIGFWAISGVKMGKYLQQEKYRKAFNWVMAALLIASLIPILKK